MTTVTHALELLTALALVASALVVLVRPRRMHDVLAAFPSRIGGRIVLAAMIALPGVALVLAVAVPFIAFFAAGYAACTAAVVGIYAALRGAVAMLPLPVGIVVVSLAVAGFQPLGLKVLNLPKAAVLPYEPVPFSVVNTYGEGVWFESVRVAADGTLYLAANIGLDFSRGDYYHGAHGEVIARKPDGSERVIFTTPVNTLAGCFAIAPDNTIYMASNGVTPAIWRITPDGHGEPFAALPAHAWPNGLAFGPDGKLYSSDSVLGSVWRIDPHTGAVDTAVKDAALTVRSALALAPGANGLQFRGREMLVTVSDRTTVLGFAMRDDGTFAAPTTIATGIPGDDFAVGRDGSLFVTTHPYNTVVRVAPDGRRTVIADARQRIIGATDAQFGRTAADRDTLYVATDGGAFTGGPHTRGQLIALQPYAKH